MCRALVLQSLLTAWHSVAVRFHQLTAQACRWAEGCVAWRCMQSVQRSAQQKMLMREPGKQPMIGRDRLTALRNANSLSTPNSHSHGASSGSRTSSGKLVPNPGSNGQSPRQPEPA